MAGVESCAPFCAPSPLFQANYLYLNEVELSGLFYSIRLTSFFSGTSWKAAVFSNASICRSQRFIFSSRVVSRRQGPPLGQNRNRRAVFKGVAPARPSKRPPEPSHRRLLHFEPCDQALPAFSMRPGRNWLPHLHGTGIMPGTGSIPTECGPA